jgi:hypothetical protein
VYLESSSENSISSNNFSRNWKDNGYFHAEEKIYTNNYWNGNYWDDWNGIGPKRIEGLLKTKFYYIDNWGNRIYHYLPCYNYDWNPNTDNIEYNHFSKNTQQQTTTQQTSNMQQTQTTSQQIVGSNFLNRLVRR